MNIAPKSIESYKINASNKVTTLNPNAAEFVPSALRSSSGNTKGEGSAIVDSTRTSGKSILDCSKSSISNISNNSDDEAHQYWRHQLPDDITPDFKVIGEDDMSHQGQLSLAGLSIRDSIEPSRFSASMARETFGTQQRRSLGANNFNPSGNMGYSGSTFTKDQLSAACIVSATNSWDKHFVNGDQQFTRGMEGKHYNGKSSASFLNGMLGGQDVIDAAAIGPVEFLTSQFPGYSAESLADMYYASGCDLNFTIEMLGHLELQADGGFSQNLNSKSLSVPSLNKLDLQSLSRAESHGGLSKYTQDLHQVSDTYRSTSNLFPDATSFASAARKFSPLDSSLWKHERNGSADGSIGSSRSSQLLASSYNGHGKLLYGDKVPSPGTSRIAPLWLETGEAVGNTFQLYILNSLKSFLIHCIWVTCLYLCLSPIVGRAENIHSESREEARQLAHLRDACLEQASQAYLLGNKTLARELSEKGHLYNMQLKAALMKTGDTIYRKRDPISYELHGYNRGSQDRLIDLHGLHVSDALHVLKHELNVLRSTAGSSRHRPQATIFLGTGKTARVSPRLPMAVEQFLLEEGLTYAQPQPGLLHVVIY